MKKLLALVLAAVALSATAAPTSKAVAELKQADQRRQENITDADMISPETAYLIESASKSLNEPLKPATPKEIKAVVKTAAFKAAMQPGRDNGDFELALMP